MTEFDESQWIKELHNWVEPTRGLLRYVIGVGAAYEIHIIKQDLETSTIRERFTQDAEAQLYFVGEWPMNQLSESMFFERKLLLSGTLKECLRKAADDYKEHKIT